VAWFYAYTGISAIALPNNSQVLTDAYNQAVAEVNDQFAAVPGPTFQLMTYNLAAHYVVLWAPDQTDGNGNVDVFYPSPPADSPNTGNNLGYFYWLRQSYGLSSFTAGMVSASSDESTSTTLEVPEALKNLTIGNLIMMRDPWGRQYLAWAQDAGGIFDIS